MSIFKDFVESARLAGVLGKNSPASKDWYLENSINIKRRQVNPKRFLTENKDMLVTKPILGKMYAFLYKPVTETLPFFDQFPLIFHLEWKPGRENFLALNMHYLSLKTRAQFFEALLDRKVKDRLKANYSILKNAKKFRAFKPAIKQYRRTAVLGRYLEIPEDQWEASLYMPNERFIKKHRNTVHLNSDRLIRKNT